MMYFYVTVSKKPYRFLDTAEMRSFLQVSIFFMYVYGRAFYSSTPPQKKKHQSNLHLLGCKLPLFLDSDRLKDDPVELHTSTSKLVELGSFDPNYPTLETLEISWCNYLTRTMKAGLASISTIRRARWWWPMVPGWI